MFFALLNKIKKPEEILNLPSKLTIQGICYEILYSFHKQKSSTCRIKDQKIILRLSAYQTPQKAEFQAQNLLSRFKKHLSKFPSKKNLLGFDLKDGIKLQTFLENFIVKIVSVEKTKLKILIQRPYIRIFLPLEQKINTALILKNLRKKLADFYKIDIEELVQKINQNFFKASIKKINLKELKSRWGSCSNTKNINLSNRLLLLPKDCLIYVIHHELAHLIISNHSKKFWALVAKTLPDYKAKRKKLREYIV